MLPQILLRFAFFLGLCSGFAPLHLSRRPAPFIAVRTHLYSTNSEAFALETREFVLTLPMGLVLEDSETGGVDVIDITDRCVRRLSLGGWRSQNAAKLRLSCA